VPEQLRQWQYGAHTVFLGMLRPATAFLFTSDNGLRMHTSVPGKYLTRSQRPTRAKFGGKKDFFDVLWIAVACHNNILNALLICDSLSMGLVALKCYNIDSTTSCELMLVDSVCLCCWLTLSAVGRRCLPDCCWQTVSAVGRQRPPGCCC